MPRKSVITSNSKRRVFSQEFKQEAVQMLLDGHTASLICLTAKTLRHPFWSSKLQSIPEFFKSFTPCHQHKSKRSRPTSGRLYRRMYPPNVCPDRRAMIFSLRYGRTKVAETDILDGFTGTLFHCTREWQCLLRFQNQVRWSFSSCHSLEPAGLGKMRVTTARPKKRGNGLQISLLGSTTASSIPT